MQYSIFSTIILLYLSLLCIYLLSKPVMLGTFRTLINAEKHLAGINKE